ncbi:hypothetical protein LR48_Vigan118s003000 [Vigna angularis]|uniref:Uncharacterized protein n=1 Tax=Phaseolus angularis TaxID=3914 RepID=A0A0L9T4Q2_PHAAN|nr:hypothetical protein LR48_Vigan118s003000 [Vigna angularis]
MVTAHDQAATLRRRPGANSEVQQVLIHGRERKSEAHGLCWMYTLHTAAHMRSSHIHSFSSSNNVHSSWRGAHGNPPRGQQQHGSGKEGT